jgi:hypothetical protein
LVADVAEAVHAAHVVVELPRAAGRLGVRAILLQRLLALGLRTSLILASSELGADGMEAEPPQATKVALRIPKEARALHAAMMHALATG